MTFLKLSDYRLRIREKELLKVIENDYTIIEELEKDAIEESSLYLRQKYDLSEAFKTATSNYNSGSTYNTDEAVWFNPEASGSTDSIYLSLVDNNTSNPLNSDVWSKTDIRNPLIKRIILDIVLYRLHSVVASVNVPQTREKNYLDAIGFLKDLARAKYNSTLPKNQGMNNFLPSFGITGDTLTHTFSEWDVF